MKLGRLKIRIGKKLFIGYLMVIGLFVLFFYLNNNKFKNKTIEESILSEARQAQLSFKYTGERDVNMLSSALAAISRDPNSKMAYLEKDRDKLYEYNQALFLDLKNKYGITHWYFILPDGHVFLRMHQKDQYGDEVARATFKQARDTGQISSGIELGKTAYALRVVEPYYDNGVLIGYVELGEEIDHFLKILKHDTDSELSIMADKFFLNSDDWAATRRAAGLRDNWDDLSNHLVIGATAETESTKKCFTQEIAEQLEQKKETFLLIQNEKKYFGCVGFAIEDVSGRHTGEVLVLTDVSDHIAIAKTINRAMSVYLAGISILTLSLGAFFSRSLSNSIKKLSEGSAKISRGDFDCRVDIQTGDEIEELGNDFNIMAEKLQEHYVKLEEAKTDVENQVLEKTKELRGILVDLEKMNNLMSGRELKMIELKKRIKELEAEKEQPLKKG